MRRVVIAIGMVMSAGCRPDAPEPARDRAAALTAAQDTVRREWRREVRVDSAETRADTTIVWVSPRDWLATDAPQARVRVLAGGRIVGIQWILGG